MRLRILQMYNEQGYNLVFTCPGRLPISKTPFCQLKRLFPAKSIFSGILM